MSTNNWTAVPDELKKLKTWLLWHKSYNDKKQKFDKIPDEFIKKNPLTGRYYTWDAIELKTFDEAFRELYSPTSRSDGIGIAMRADNTIAGIDIDNAILKDGSYNEPIRKIILPVLAQARKDHCYIEKSVSGTGYHIYGYTSLKPHLLEINASNIKSDPVEIYFAKSYLTVSGNVCSPGFGCLDNSIRIAYRIIKGTELNTTKETQDLLFRQPENNQTRIDIPQAIKQPQNANKSVTYSDEDVKQLPLLNINTVMNLMSKDTRYNGMETFNALQYPYPHGINESDQDMKIIGVLVFWLYRFGEAEVARIFETSLMFQSHKDKKSPEYVMHTVTKAFRNAQKFFPAANYKRMNEEQTTKLKNWLKAKGI